MSKPSAWAPDQGGCQHRDRSIDFAYLLFTVTGGDIREYPGKYHSMAIVSAVCLYLYGIKWNV